MSYTTKNPLSPMHRSNRDSISEFNVCVCVCVCVSYIND